MVHLLDSSKVGCTIGGHMGKGVNKGIPNLDNNVEAYYNAKNFSGESSGEPPFH